MTDNIKTFRPREPNSESRDWTPRQALLVALIDLEERGWTKAVIVMGKFVPEGGGESEGEAWEWEVLNAGANTLEQEGMMMLALKGEGL